MKSARLIFVFILLLTFQWAFGQARNSIGVGGGINLPLKSDYSIGRDRVLQAQLFSGKQWALMPVLGWESIKNKQRSAFDLAFLNLAAKYYMSKKIFTYAGPLGYVAGNDGGVVGLGGTVGAGYDWAFDSYSSLEFSLRTDFLPGYLNLPPAAGLRIAYKFSFKSKDGRPSRFDIP